MGQNTAHHHILFPPRTETRPETREKGGAGDGSGVSPKTHPIKSIRSAKSSRPGGEASASADLGLAERGHRSAYVQSPRTAVMYCRPAAPPVTPLPCNLRCCHIVGQPPHISPAPAPPPTSSSTSSSTSTLCSLLTVQTPRLDCRTPGRQ